MKKKSPFLFARCRSAGRCSTQLRESNDKTEAIGEAKVKTHVVEEKEGNVSLSGDIRKNVFGPPQIVKACPKI